MQMLVVYAKDLKDGFADYAEPVSWRREGCDSQGGGGGALVSCLGTRLR